MRLLFVADGRSPIALNWICYFLEQGHEVHLVSTFPCSPGLPLDSLQVVPVAFSAKASAKARDKGIGDQGERDKGIRNLLWSDSMTGLRTTFKQWAGPLTLRRAAGRLQEIAAQVRPDLVHAMRIPYEGMLAALADPPAPLLVSVWGNDFTLHAPANRLMKEYTRKTLRRCDALHTDCFRDVRLAHAWGFPDERPAVVLPGGGGVQRDVFYPAGEGFERGQETGGRGNEGDMLVINPRGVRAYVRNDTFFQAIPRILERRPEVRFVCTGMAGELQAQRWLDALGIGRSVDLLPRQPRPQMAVWFRQAQVAVSPTTHDGTPNTLLEAMACGCFPVAGDIESLREWITPGVNGLLVDPGDPQQLADAILLALEQVELRRHAAQVNLDLVARRAEHGQVMREAEAFYQKIVGNWGGRERGIAGFGSV